MLPKPLIEQVTSDGRNACRRDVGKPHAGQHAGAEVFDQHVRSLDQPRQDQLRLRLAQVQHDRALIAIELGKIPGETVLDGALTADRVTLGRFDLDDVGAQVAKQRGAERAREHTCQVEDPHSGQRHLPFPCISSADQSGSARIRQKSEQHCRARRLDQAGDVPPAARDADGRTCGLLGRPRRHENYLMQIRIVRHDFDAGKSRPRHNRRPFSCSAGIIQLPRRKGNRR